VQLQGTSDVKTLTQKAGLLARDRDVQEVINYRNVINWIDNWEDYADEKKIFSINTLKTLHALSTKDIIDANYVGNFRDKQVVVSSGPDSSVVFRPPVSVEIPFLLEEFFEWLNTLHTRQNTHAIFQAAITHYQLVYVHPFIEGNGRTARAMATLALYVAGYDFKRFFSIEQYFDSDVDAYYQALLSVQQSQNHDMTYWLEYFCYGLAIEIEKIKDQVMKLSKDLKMKQELGQQVSLSERQIILLELLQNQGEISSNDAQQVLPNVSVDTILRDLKDLLEKGVVKRKGVTKGVTYTLKD
jgi:Fic family protein